MSFDDELGFRLVDDPAPPEPDPARLQRAVARGRQRLLRRRALVGAATAAVAFGLIGGGVAVARRNDSAPDVRINPPTTVAGTSENVREADANGLRYTLTLETPVVSAGATVTVALNVENRTDNVVAIGVCDLEIHVVPVSPRTSTGVLCNGPGVQTQPRSSQEETTSTTAPLIPGEYVVLVEPGEFPRSLLEDPLRLRVVAVDGSTTTTTTPNSSELLGPRPTEAATVPTTVGGAVQGEDPRTPHATDFSGSLTASATSVSVGEGVNFDLTIRNITNHVIEPSLNSISKGVAVVCANDLSPLGHTGMALGGDVNLFFVTSPSLAPLDSAGRSGTYTPTSSDVGVVTCAGVIIATTDHWRNGTISSVAQLANVPSVSFTVTPAAVETTTSAASSTSSTTAP